MTTRVLAVANQKGGVAKTTTVASLGAAMVDAGRRVLLVDLDPQGCLTFSLGQDPDKLAVSVHEVLLGEVEPDVPLVDTAEGMTLLPANIDLAGAEAMLLMRAGTARDGGTSQPRSGLGASRTKQPSQASRANVGSALPDFQCLSSA